MQSICNDQQTEYEFAGFWVRLAAYVIDSMIVFGLLLAVRLFFAGVSLIAGGEFLEKGILFQHTLKDIVLYLLQVTYFILSTYMTGTTLGKKALKLKVIRADGDERPELRDIIYRETIGRFLCCLSAGIGYLLAGADLEKRGLHDMLCDTRVIYARVEGIHS